MGTTQDHRKCAEECFAMAQLSRHDSDKALWLTLAQSWVRLAEHVERGGPSPDSIQDDDESILESARDDDEPSAELVEDAVEES